MSKTARWTFIRHAPVIAKGLLYGASDVPADCSDQAAFAALAGNLPTDAVWLSSHLSRAQDTLKAIIRSGPAEALHGADAFVIDRRFAEQDFGTWEGESYADLQHAQATAYQQFWQDPANATPPAAKVLQRLLNGLQQPWQVGASSTWDVTSSVSATGVPSGRL
jgi:alpha-ribazole phosphatase